MQTGGPIVFRRAPLDGLNLARPQQVLQIVVGGIHRKGQRAYLTGLHRRAVTGRNGNDRRYGPTAQAVLGSCARDEGNPAHVLKLAHDAASPQAVVVDNGCGHIPHVSVGVPKGSQIKAAV